MTKLNLIQYDALTGLLRPDPFFEKVVQKIELREQAPPGDGGLRPWSWATWTGSRTTTTGTATRPATAFSATWPAS